VEIVELGTPGGQPVEAYGSVGVTAQALVRQDGVAVTVLRVGAGGEVGRHPAVGDQLMVIVAGRGAVRAGDGPWQDVHAGHAVRWSGGEEHVTRAVEDITALVVETL
jgi:quercetin dioxygenase-like cupin family protein